MIRRIGFLATVALAVGVTAVVARPMFLFCLHFAVDPIHNSSDRDNPFALVWSHLFGAAAGVVAPALLLGVLLLLAAKFWGVKPHESSS